MVGGRVAEEEEEGGAATVMAVGGKEEIGRRLVFCWQNRRLEKIASWREWGERERGDTKERDWRRGVTVYKPSAKRVKSRAHFTAQ
jgi:hypothetical protein